MSALSILVFMLVQGHVVSNEKQGWIIGFLKEIDFKFNIWGLCTISTDCVFLTQYVKVKPDIRKIFDLKVWEIYKNSNSRSRTKWFRTDIPYSLSQVPPSDKLLLTDMVQDLKILIFN